MGCFRIRHLADWHMGLSLLVAASRSAASGTRRTNQRGLPPRYVQQHERAGTFLKRQEMEKDYPTDLVKDLTPERVWDMKFSYTHPMYGPVIHMNTPGEYLLVAISYPWFAKEPCNKSGTLAPARLFCSMLSVVRCF